MRGASHTEVRTDVNKTMGDLQEEYVRYVAAHEPAALRGLVFVPLRSLSPHQRDCTIPTTRSSKAWHCRSQAS
jgi:hypothetical protein